MIQQIELEQPPILIHEFIHAEEKIDALIISLERYAKCFDADLDRGLLEEETIAVFHEFEAKANEIVNGLYFKPLTHQLSEDFYGKYFYLLHSLEAGQEKWGKHERRKEVHLASEAKFAQNLDLDLRGFLNEFKIIIRYWLCNSSRILSNKEIDSIMKNVAKIYDRVIEEPSNVNTWKLLNDLLGFNKNRLKTTVFERQIYGNPTRSLSRFNPMLRIDDFAPLAFHASLYSNIRAKFPVLLREAFLAASSIKESEEIWENVEKLLFPPMAINGSCIFNGKSFDKSKEDMAFGIYLEQYNHLTTVLTDAKGPKHNINAAIQLEKRKIISKLFETMKLKSIKIADRPRNNQMENRFRARQAQTPEEIIQHLAEMGIERSYAEIALENIEYPDQNLAVQWIDNNRDQVEELLMLKALEKSKASRNNSNQRQQQVVKDGIVEVTLDKFRKEVSGASLRNWIKFLYKELFQSTNMEEIYSVKDILFLCMDYLAEDAKVKQYVNFNEKIIKDIDDLNKEDNIAVKLKRLISLMETMVDKLPKSRSLFYEKSINMKAISFLPRLNEEDQGKIFSLLNAYLPIVVPEILTPELEEYLHYLLDLTYKHRMNSKAIIQIFYKIAKSKKLSLIERITRNIVEYLSLNLIKESIVPILSIVFESDRQLSQTNAELDLKTYIFERYKHRINAFHPEKQHVLEMDIKEFSTNFSKYDKDSSIYEVSKRLLSKKKNKNKYFYYDCRKQDNAFDYSVFAKQKFIGFALKDHHKTIVRCMIALLLRSPQENQQELMIQILKILTFCRILLPFTLNENVDGTNLLQWLLDSPNQSKYKYKLLAFLTLNNNIFIRKADNLYGFYSIADYTCAKIIYYVTTKKEIKYETVLSCYYLQQIRRFSEFCTTPLSHQNKTTLLSYMEEAFQNADPVQHLAITELLNVQYKRILLNNLRRKYKMIGVQSQPYFERQFLNLSAFYNSLAIKEPEPKSKPTIPSRNPIPVPVQQPQLGQDLGSDSEQDNSGNNVDLREGRPNLLLEDGSYFNSLSLGRRQNNIFFEQLLTPLPQRAEKQGEVEQVLEPIVILNSFTVEDIITLFNQYFAFDIEIQDKVVIHEASLPVRPIKVNENISFKVNLNDGAIDIELRVRKNAGFERHFNEIMHFLSGKTLLQEKKPATAFEKRVQEISRRIFSGDAQVTLQYRQEMLQQLERLMLHRENREEEAQQQQQVRVLNAADIYSNVPEFADPIVPVVPKPAKVEVEPRVEEQVPIEPVVNDPPKNQEVPMDIEQPIEQNVVQEQQQQLQQAAEEVPVVVPVVQPVEQVQPVQLFIPVEPVIPVIQVEPVVPIVAEQVQVVEQVPLVVGPNIVQEQLIQEAEIPPPAVNPPANQPPIRDREILRVFGLPQTFLRDAGIDEESFDCLPQDFQQEQLMHLISQQNRAASRPQSASNPNNNNPPVVDQVNENVAFLASLDIHTRAQVLIEATPEFLSTLPANIREEAENLRHQQINRIIEEEEIEEERKMASEKPKANVVYPKVKTQEFSRISEHAAKQLFCGIFYIYPNFKLPAIKILLENKQNQARTVTSIVALLRYLEKKERGQLFPLKEVKMVEGEFIVTNFQEWSEQQVKNIRTSLLHTIYEHLKIPFYKDQQFLIGKLPAEAYLAELQQFFQGEKQVQTQIEFFEFSLKYYPALSSELIRTITDLPERLLVQIVEGIKVDSFPKEFYENLQNFSDNEKLKELFNTYFEHQRPKIEILGRLLRYNFSHVPYLRKVHEEALEYFNNTYYDFLNQIFRIYTLETLEAVEPMLVKHKAIHFQVIKYLYQANRQLEKQPIAILLKKPHLLDFQTKKFIFRNHPRIRKLSRHRVHIEVDRNHLFQGSYNQLMSRSLRELEGRIQVSFVNEPGYDAGGLKREWFLVVSREIFNQDYALFQKSSSGSTYQPNPKSYINPDHLNYFKFIGRFIGKALVERELIDAYFTRAFYKMILGQELQFKDLEAQDYEFYKSMEWLKNNPIDEDMFTFSYIYDNFGNKIEKELLPGGKAIIVNEENKKEYIEKYCLSKMRDDFSTQINKFLEGFYEIVPQECISFFEAKELELLISGVPEVDVEDLKENTDYSGYAPGDQIIQWFWEIVEGYSQEDLAKLVQFITGTSKIPVQGFSQLVGMNGIQRISIHRDPCEHQLPKSHTCFNQLDLPNYPSKQILQEKLAICLAWGSEGFGFM